MRASAILMLWYCSKLEYVVRSCAKAWLERQDLREEANFREMCYLFTTETREYSPSRHQIFTCSLAHIHGALMHHTLEHRVLGDGSI